MRPRAGLAGLLALPLAMLLLVGVGLAGAAALRLGAAIDRGMVLHLAGEALVASGLAMIAALPTLALMPFWRAALLVPLAAGMAARRAGLALVPMPPVLAAALLVLPLAVGVMWWCEPASLAADRRAAAACGAGALARRRWITIPARLPGLAVSLLVGAALAAGVLAVPPP